jgi:rubredoxin
VIILRSRFWKIFPAVFLVIIMIGTFGFTIGLYGDTSIWKCSLCGYVYDPIVEGVPFEELPDDWVCPNPDCTCTKAGFSEVILFTWVCPYCGYVYDPVVEGVPFEELPDDWVCPVCNTPSTDFVKDSEYGGYISTDPWVAHLQHVLEMRSKHLAVLQRVITAHMVKGLDHSSIPGLKNALESSTKTVLKAKADIDAYLEYLANPTTTSIVNEEEGNTEDTDLLLNSGNGQNEGKSNGNEKENKGNNNNGKNENKEKENNGKALGKNK